ncbi:MAG: tRNA (guanosine(46)-N7)-methyltransferase TrmB [Firmicutes bacterium]|nr:tRNA (guanosine(46)-N7)-methyltransferase TrmB [Bacillota bacterium]
MRQRTVKNLEEKMANNSSFLIKDPREAKGHWAEIFGNTNPVYLEIGCGKGKFILTRAQRNPDANYIAVEGQENVILRAMEKAEAAGLANLRLFNDFVNDLNDYFEKGELAGVYLNFSDPWPKARHDKRRLTYHKRLENYFQVMDEAGFVEFKTDNEGLFEFTLEEIALLEEKGLKMAEMTRDLHGEDCSYESRLVTTEYEDKFSAAGKNINYVKITK